MWGTLLVKMKRFNMFAAAIALISMPMLQAANQPAAVKVGDKAPDFTLTSTDHKQVSLSDYAGKQLVLVFSRAHW